VVRGCSVTEASRQVGVSRKHGSELYLRELQSVSDSMNETRPLMLAQDLETLRLIAQAHMGPATGTAVVLDEDQIIRDRSGEERYDALIFRVAPSPASAKIVIAALDRRAKLLGLDAAVKVEISQARINDTVDEIVGLLDDASDTELAEVLDIDRGAG
jgi:hypothetical protein